MLFRFLEHEVAEKLIKDIMDLDLYVVSDSGMKWRWAIALGSEDSGWVEVHSVDALEETYK